MKHFYANGRGMGFAKGFYHPIIDTSYSLCDKERGSKIRHKKSTVIDKLFSSMPEMVSFFAPLSPAQGDHFFLDKKVRKNQDCIPLCDQTSKNLNDLELTTFKHKIIPNDSSSVCLRSRNARSSFSASADYVAEASNVFVSSDGRISHQMGASVVGEALNDSDFDAIETKPVLMINGQRDVRQIALDETDHRELIDTKNKQESINKGFGSFAYTKLRSNLRRKQLGQSGYEDGEHSALGKEKKGGKVLSINRSSRHYAPHDDGVKGEQIHVKTKFNVLSITENVASKFLTYHQRLSLQESIESNCGAIIQSAKKQIIMDNVFSDTVLFTFDKTKVKAMPRLEWLIGCGLGKEKEGNCLTPRSLRTVRGDCKNEEAVLSSNRLSRHSVARNDCKKGMFSTYLPLAYSFRFTTLLIFVSVLFKNAYSQGTIVGDPKKAPKISQVYRPYLQGKVISNDPDLSLRTQVYIEGTDIVIYSDKQGNFNFRGVYVESGNIMVYSKVLKNFIRVAFDTENRGPFIVNLQDSADSSKQIDTVAVVAETGYFRVPEERATGSFVHIDNKLLSRTVGSNILDRLNGVTRGLIFNNNQVGATTFASNRPPMSIRGVSTLFANAEPLIILDNFPFEGDVHTINPEDIESVTILQDAAAASIWGAKAGNGVIVLTSKKGRFEQPLRVSLRSDISVSEKPDLYYNPTIPMDEVIAIERFLYEKGAWNGAINQIHPYITPTIEALLAHKNGHILESEMESRIAKLKTQDVRRDLNRYVYRPVQLYKGAINFRGGAKQHNYYFSVGYDKNLADISGHHDERITLQARNSYTVLNNKVLFDMDLQFSSGTKRTGGDAPYQVLYDRIADENGDPLSIGGGRSSAGLRQSYIDTAGMGLLKDWNFYPLDNIHQYAVSATQTSYRVQPSITYKPFGWLSIAANYQFARSYSESRGLMDEEYFDQRDLYNKFTKINYTTGIAVSTIPKGGRLNQTNSGLSTHYFRGSFNIDKTWGGIHQLHMIGGMELSSKSTLNRSLPVMMGYQEATESYVPFDPMVRRYQYLTRGMGTIFTVTPINMSHSTTINRNRLYFGNASYTYDKRYTATFSARKDEANIFGVDINQRGRPFWSAGLRWQIQEEDFYQVDWLSKLVLRTTHGYTGNVSNLSAYIVSRIASDPYSYTNRIYQTITTPPNPQLGWENVRMNNIAVDFAIFNNRLSGSVEHYRKKATDLLSSQPINPSSGVTSLFGNWSSLKGWGWDMNLTAKNIQSSDFLWQSDLILSYTDEKVTDYKLKPNSDINYLTSNLGSYPIEGKPLYGMYSFASAGLDANGQPQGYLDGQLSQDYASIYNKTSLGDYVYHGRATPNVFGSIRNTIQYKALDLSFNITAQFGYYVRRRGINYGTLYSVSSYTNLPFQYDYTNRWQSPGDELHTHVPVAQYPVVGNREIFYNMTDHLVEKGDHIRLRDIRLGYTVKLPRMKLSSIQVYAYANNIGILWAANQSGFDPDAVFSNSMVYPAVRTYSLGVNINF